MKIGKIVLAALILLIAYSVVAFVDYIFSFGIYGGCLPREDFDASTTVEPEISCLTIATGTTCLGGIALHVQSECQEVFLYDTNDTTMELYNYDEWLKSYQNTANVDYYIEDLSVPQDFGTWTRELRYKDNPDDKILITANVMEKRRSVIDPDNLKALIPTGIKMVVLAVVLVSLYFLFRKGKKK